MSWQPTLGLLLPPLLGGVLVLASHVPLGMRVLRRGIVFLDLAIAQIAALGVILAGLAGLESPLAVQLAAALAAVLGALLLAWMERRWPEVQEAQIGVVFVLAASACLLLLARHPHGDEQLRNLLAGQILWLDYAQLRLPALLSAGLLLVLWRVRPLPPLLFYLIFALAVTVSVQLVGVYLVFASLILPALATRHYQGLRRLCLAYLTGLGGYVSGLLLSLWWDLPAGALIVWCCTCLGLLLFALGPARRAHLSPA